MALGLGCRARRVASASQALSSPMGSSGRGCGSSSLDTSGFMGAMLVPIQAMFTSAGLAWSHGPYGGPSEVHDMLRAGLILLTLMALGSTAMAHDRVRVFVTY